MTDYRTEGRGKHQQYWNTDRDQDRDQQLWGGSQYGSQYGRYYNQDQQQSWAYQGAKLITAATAGGSLLILSGLTLAGTVIALTIATPLLVIFSPVLVPALITVFMLATGMFASGGFGVAAITVLTWMYRYMTGGDRSSSSSWSNTFDQASHKLGSKARDFKDRTEHALGGGGGYGTGGGLHAGGGGGYGTGAGQHTGGTGVGIHAGVGGGTYSS